MFYFRGSDNTTYDLNTFINTICDGEEQKDIITTWAPADTAANATLENMGLSLSAFGVLFVDTEEEKTDVSADVNVTVIDSCGGNATLQIALILTNATDESPTLAPTRTPSTADSDTTTGEREESVNATGSGSPSLAPSLAPTDNKPSLSPTVLLRQALTPTPPTPAPGVVALTGMLGTFAM
jgi:hypothetical protein